MQLLRSLERMLHSNLVELLQRSGVAVVPRVQLGGQEQLAALDAAAPQRLTHQVLPVPLAGLHMAPTLALAGACPMSSTGFCRVLQGFCAASPHSGSAMPHCRQTSSGARLCAVDEAVAGLQRPFHSLLRALSHARGPKAHQGHAHILCNAHLCMPQAASTPNLQVARSRKTCRDFARGTAVRITNNVAGVPLWARQ